MVEADIRFAHFRGGSRSMAISSPMLTVVSGAEVEALWGSRIVVVEVVG